MVWLVNPFNPFFGRFVPPFGPTVVTVPGPQPPDTTPVQMSVSNDPLLKAVIINVGYGTVLDVDTVNNDNIITTAKFDPYGPPPTLVDSQSWDIMFNVPLIAGKFHTRVWNSSITAGTSGKQGVTVGNPLTTGSGFELRLGSDLTSDTLWYMSQLSLLGSNTLTPGTAPFRISRSVGNIDYYWTATGTGTSNVTLTQVAPNDLGSQLWIVCYPAKV